MKVIILGAGGMLGTQLVAELYGSEGIELKAYPRELLDIREEHAVSLLVKDCDVVINATAYTDVDGCEDEMPQAFEINGWALRTLGRITEDRGIRVIHYSTDFVFDGKRMAAPWNEQSVPDPVNAYGSSKLLGEQELQDSNPNHLIIRTQGLFGFAGQNFIGTMVRRALQEQHTQVVTDQIGKVTDVQDLAIFTASMLAQPHRTGLLHFANSGVCSKYDVAHSVFNAAGKGEYLQACLTEDFPTRAVRPAWSPLSSVFRMPEPLYVIKSGRERVLEYVETCLLEGGLSDEPN
ncbi:MAG: dTDP-4-dehydrorhamnose reductase [Bacteroidales bacterium]|nr:dTDP-4-dehydrorhamnose reductase [Candidatus Latescibacterota bacterium]